VKSIEIRRRTNAALTGVSVSTRRWRQRWPLANSTRIASASGCARVAMTSSNHIAMKAGGDGRRKRHV
jgi:hypothetical protein